jgi:hypothetical protein
LAVGTESTEHCRESGNNAELFGTEEKSKPFGDMKNCLSMAPPDILVSEVGIP